MISSSRVLKMFQVTVYNWESKKSAVSFVFKCVMERIRAYLMGLDVIDERLCDWWVFCVVNCVCVIKGCFV